MLARIISILYPGPVPPPPPVEIIAASSRGIWEVSKLGAGWNVDTPIGNLRVLDIQRVIEAAAKVGATIKWLD